MSTEEPPREAPPEAQPEPGPEAQPEPEAQPRRRGFRTGRLEAFSDGVFAIAVTLLILDIGVSGTAGHDLGAAIRGLWPSYLAYIASFSTRLVAEFIRQDKAERVAVTFYGIVLLLSSTLLLVLWRYAVRAKLVRPDLADEEIELLTERLTPGLGAYLVLIVSGLFVPVIAVIGFLGIALYYIIPFRRLSASILPRGWRRKRHRR